MQEVEEASDPSLAVTVLFSGVLYTGLLAWISYYHVRKQYLAFKYQSGVAGSKLENLLRVEAAKRNRDFDEYRDYVIQNYRWFKYYQFCRVVILGGCVVCPIVTYLEKTEQA